MKHDPRPDPHLSDPAPVSSPGAAENVPSPGTSRPGAAPPAALRPPRTMAELKTMLPRLGYSARVEAQVRPQVDHCIAVYGRPLKRISADRAALEAKWGRGAGGPAAIPKGFRYHGHSVDFRRRLGPALRRAALLGGAAGPSSLVPLGLGWGRLVTFCQEHQAGQARRVPPHVHVSPGALGSRATRLGLTPIGLAQDGAGLPFAEAVGKERRPFNHLVCSLAGPLQGAPRVWRWFPRAE